MRRYVDVERKRAEGEGKGGEGRGGEDVYSPIIQSLVGGCTPAHEAIPSTGMYKQLGM